MEQPLISVIVPVYKVEDYLDECVQSIVNQTYENLEIILVDDGSPDRCPEMCDEWAKRDSRIKVIHKENGGASSARNVGLDIAKGEYIGFVDSDDYIAENMYEIMIGSIQKYGKKISTCGSIFVKENREKVAGVGILEEKNLDTEDAIRAVFYKRVGTAVWCKLFARDVFVNLRFPVGETNEEFPLIIPMIKKAQGIVHTGKLLYYYRQREESITGNTWKKDTGIVLKNLRLMQKQLIESDLKNLLSDYDFFVAKEAYSSAISLQIHYEHLTKEANANLREYVILMRKQIWYYLCNRDVGLKDKILYLLVVSNSLRAVYKLCGKL